MEIVAVQKFIVVSPKKLRLVSDLVKKLKPTGAIDHLPHLGKSAALPLSKVIKTAIANAKNLGIQENDLVFKEIQINEGPRLKRGRAVSRGRWHPYKRRMSHIRVVLQSIEKKENLNTKKAKVVEGVKGGGKSKGKGQSSKLQGKSKK